MIQEWFFNKGSFEEGLKLLHSVCGPNKRMYLRLKNAQPTQRNLAALKYELNKYKNHKIETPVVKEKIVKKSSATDHIQILAKISLKKSNETITMAMLDNVDMRQRFREKNAAYYERWELKKQLNMLKDHEEEQALEIIIRIMKLTPLIDMIWKELDYFLKHKKPMPTARSFNDLSNMELIKTRQRLYQSRSKRQKTLDKMFKELPDTPKEKELALKSKIKDKEEKITQINIDIEKLNELINE